jgi:hypothetical protein
MKGDGIECVGVLVAVNLSPGRRNISEYSRQISFSSLRPSVICESRNLSSKSSFLSAEFTDRVLSFKLTVANSLINIYS